MKKLILFVLIVSGLFTSAQTNSFNGTCKALFKFEINNKVMTLVPATAINFYDKSEGLIKDWYWDFGNGNTSREQNPMFIFNHPTGITLKMQPYRTVSLTIVTSDNCKSFYSETINIMDGSLYEPPTCKAGFKYYQTAYDSIGGSATVQLTNLSTGDSLQYLWKFDNGKTSTEKEPKVTFDLSQKERKVCLTVSGTKNCTDTFCDAVYLISPSKPVIKPVECYTGFGFSVNYNIKTLLPALVLDFRSKALPDATEWAWDFGDGSSSTEAHPTHIFNFPLVKDSVLADPNPFRKVCLTMKTASGCVASYCETINIYMNTNPVVEPPVACHAWIKYHRADDVVSIPELIPYKLTDASEGKVIRRLWQFEDGKTSTEAEPLVSFDFQKPTQKVCLTIHTADSCTSTWCEVIYVTEPKVDTVYTEKPSWKYHMRYKSSFPIYMSSCAGTASAQVYLKDSLINADNYVWSNGTQGQETKGLCPTKPISVKAITPDGTIVSGTFILNSDGTVTEIPVNWYITGANNNWQVQYDLSDKNYTVEWRLCDGTLVRSDSIPLNSINCGAKESNMILKDASGNIVYSENISVKALATLLNPDQTWVPVKIFPNPVSDVLNLIYSGNALDELQIEICDLAGKQVSLHQLRQVESGQQISLNVNSLRKGIYLCKMVSGKQTIGIEKFIK